MSGNWEPGESWKTGSSQKRIRQDAYVEWLLLPEAEREPRTKRELAELLGVTTQTLRNYAQEPYVQQELQRRARSLARVERVGPVLDSLFAQATDQDNNRSVQAAKVLLDWTERAIDLGDERDIKELTDEEIFVLVGRLKEHLDQA